MYRFLFFIGALILLIPDIKSQGCSDAGVCSIDAYHGSEKKKESGRSLGISLSQTAELGEQNTIYFHSIVGISWSKGRFNHRLMVPYRIMGYDGNGYSGISDITISSAFRWSEKWSSTVGLKLPPNNANNTDRNGVALPMALQTSLGTYDFLASVTFSSAQWRMSGGWQHAFGSNDNAFVSNDQFPDFSTSSDLDRGDDVMIRVDRFLPRPNGYWQLALVNVYRLFEDEADGQRIDGSKGLSMNVYAAKKWDYANGSDLKLAAAVPLVVRKVRPDGLTRTFIMSLTWSGIFTKP